MTAGWRRWPFVRGQLPPAAARVEVGCGPLGGFVPALPADQLEAALEHRWLIEQAKGVLMGREQLDAQAAFERLRGAARSSTRRLDDVAREVTAGQALPATTTRAKQANDGGLGSG
jgi:hypothetical protein